MPPSSLPVAVASRSFSNNPILRAELLARFSNVTFNDSGRVLADEELVAFLDRHERAVIALERLTDAVISRLPELRVVAKYGVGLDGIDLNALTKRGIALGWTPGVNKRSVAELTLGHMIGLLRNITLAHAEILHGTWRQTTGRQLSDCTIGLIGCGHVGKEVVKLLAPFGCRILIHDLISFPEYCAATKVTQVPLATLLAESDIVSLHVPLHASTRKFFDAKAFAAMRPGSLLVNCARGGIVDEVELGHALKSGKIAGAAFDVFDVEPPTDHSLLRLSNFVASPHVGGSTKESILAMGRAAINGLSEYKAADSYI